MDWLAPGEDELLSEVSTKGEPTLRFRWWAESDIPPRATLAVLSGVMSNTAWFRPLATRWCAMGYRVVGLERRGSGLNKDDGGRGDSSSAAELIADAERVIEHGREPKWPLIIVGWCWGAILGVHVTLKLGDRVGGLALLTPGLFPSPALSDRMKALSRQAEEDPSVTALESPITDEMFTRGPALDGFIRKDEARWRWFSPRFLQVSSRLSVAARMRLSKLQVPVFAALAEDDVTTDNDQTLSELARLIKAPLTTAVFPGSHGLQFDSPQALAERLDAWARDALGV